jgi:hypothetical protein
VPEAGSGKGHDLSGRAHGRQREAETVDEYIEAAPPYAQEKLRELRAILKKVAPKAEEKLKWGSPVFEEKRILFAAPRARPLTIQFNDHPVHFCAAASSKTVSTGQIS